MEKSMATPEYYPLSLNTLTNACNQKSNRDPVVAWDEETVETAVGNLESKGLINRSSTGRVPKFEETFARQYNMVAAEAAALCILLLRGPQTPGAIRSRSDRLCAFDSLEAIQETLERLAEWGIVQRMRRLPGHKESRYTHLFSDPSTMDSDTRSTDPQPEPAPEETDRLDHLEDRIQALSDELTDLKTAFETFRQQFE
jgi:uncharacterized protein YceH (UPF0502 family)